MKDARSAWGSTWKAIPERRRSAFQIIQYTITRKMELPRVDLGPGGGPPPDPHETQGSGRGRHLYWSQCRRRRNFDLRLDGHNRFGELGREHPIRNCNHLRPNLWTC